MDLFRKVLYSLLFFALAVITLIRQTSMYPALDLSLYAVYSGGYDMLRGEATAMTNSSEDTSTVGPQPNSSSAGVNTTSPPKQPGVIRILSWTQRYDFQDNWFSNLTGTHTFSKCHLQPDMKCEYTTNKLDYESSDVVLFRARRLRSMAELPQHTNPAQKWLLMENEPPTKVWTKVPESVIGGIRNLFNLTSTYAVDSDIPLRKPMHCTIEEGLYEFYKDVDFAIGKPGLAAWFVSNCATASQREEYVRELQRYVTVDVYGECGSLKCGSVDQARNQLNKDCDDKLLNNTYKFYLSFENSLCKDYITEKLWRLFLRRVNVVPIVMGYENYTALMPEGSFVDVRDFASPKDLADFLQKADKDNILYSRYARKKNSLVCRYPMEEPYECRLCEYLHRHKNTTQTVADVLHYWSAQNKCKTLQQFIPGMVTQAPMATL